MNQLLDEGLKLKPDVPALISTRTTMTWRDLEDASGRLAEQYLTLGLRPGDRVASLMPNRAALVIHYLACFRVGLVATPLNYRYTADEIDHALSVSGASLLLYHAERESCIAASRYAGRLSRGVIRYGADGGPGRHYEELVVRPRSDAALPQVGDDVPAFVYFTSGSTGKPKGVTHSRRTYAAMLAATIAGMEIQPNDVILTGTSLSHIGGSLFGLSTLAAGGQIVLPRIGSGEEVLTLLRQQRPTILWMLPVGLFTLVDDHDAAAADFSSVRLCLSGGDKVARVLEQRFTEIAGFPIDESYGMTEIGLSMINPPSGENRLGSVGQPCPGYELSLRDETGNEVPVGTAGRLWVRSPTNMVGYWDNAQATAETIVEGWLDTGDLMRLDDEGYAWFCGRKKQIIVHDGSNICPQEVEEAIEEHPAIDAVGVIGLHDLVHGENVRAYVTLRPGAARPTSDEIIQFARERIGYKAPEEIVVLDTMPLNATGKVDRVALKTLAEAGLAANHRE
ncbi:MAG: acyl--CoA ligase [Planctomycetaceae bacterium]|nr:acyl--CoA ligase [Planctomycetaceae bacterium]